MGLCTVRYCFVLYCARTQAGTKETGDRFSIHHERRAAVREMSVSLTAAPSADDALEGRVGVGQQLLEVSLKPSSGLGRGLERILIATVGVVSDSTRVGGSLCR